jgi:hypothetical protein
MGKSVNYFFIISILILSLFSCKKSDTTQSAFSKNVKTYIVDETNAAGRRVDSFTVYYDATDRILKALSPDSSIFFRYLSGNTFSKQVKSDSITTLIELFYVNANNGVDSSLRYTIDGDSIKQKFEYNDQQQLTSMKTYHFTNAQGLMLLRTNEYTYDANGNRIRDIESDEMSNVISTTSYTYGEQAADLFTIRTFFEPTAFTNLPLTESTLFNGSGNTVSYQYAYTFDENGRVISQTQTGNLGNTIVRTYKY